MDGARAHFIALDLGPPETTVDQQLMEEGEIPDTEDSAWIEPFVNIGIGWFSDLLGKYAGFVRLHGDWRVE